MPKTVTLVRPFHFSTPPTANQRMPSEQKFYPKKDPHSGEWIPTEVELPDVVANHEWVSTHFADGCIERPEVTADRIKQKQATREKQEADDARELKKAEDALKRASGAHDVHKAAAAATDQQLNTPVNELDASRGGDVDKKIDEAALTAELNTPVNELQAGNVSPAKSRK